jgi:hypothetical protein
MTIELIGWLLKEPGPTFATRRLAARVGKKADDRIMRSYLDANPTTVSDRPVTQTLTSATTTEVSDILMKRN